ncbi:MAG: hypothetical protein OQL06_14440 [Gammaproteobacteria bacterium]|nr:hypothetical protein [Gammaproteobacteria bacterium]
MNSSVFKFGLIIAVASLTACKHDSASDVQIKEHSAMSQTGKYPGKPVAPIDINYAMSKSAAVGETLEVEVQISTRKNVDDLKVVYTTPHQLESADMKMKHSFGSVNANEKQVVNISVIPQSKGMYYIKLLATLVVDGRSQSRSFAIPVNIGNVDPKAYMKSPTGEVIDNGSGRRIISMPAQVSE